MTWNKTKPPGNGDTRIKTGFLLLPKNINDEIRWLQKSSWVQIYRHKGFNPFTLVYSFGWTNLYWYD